MTHPTYKEMTGEEQPFPHMTYEPSRHPDTEGVWWVSDEDIFKMTGKTPRQLDYDELQKYYSWDIELPPGRRELSMCYLEESDPEGLLVFYSKKTGQPCPGDDFITDEYPRAELNPDCELRMDMDWCLDDWTPHGLDLCMDNGFPFGMFILQGDVACADGMEWELQYEVTARFVQVPISEEK